jgi:dTDP-4-dehydrorhamnose reductase
MTLSILVFGADGQVGRELQRTPPPRGYVVVGLSRSEADVTKPAEIVAAMTAIAPSFVINAAAYTGVDAAEDDPDTAMRVNRDGAAHIARACAVAGVPLLHLSTDYVFDGSKPADYIEEDETAPLNAYGRSKDEGERAVRDAWEHHIILRTSWVYSAHGNNFVRTILKLGRERSEVSVVDDQTGCPTAAPNVAAALLAICGWLASDHIGWGTYHYTDDTAMTWCEFARRTFILAAAMKRQRTPRVVPVRSADYPSKAKRPLNSRLDTIKIEHAFGIKPSSFEAALRRIVTDLTNETP